jgi:hypothetical protein
MNKNCWIKCACVTPCVEATEKIFHINMSEAGKAVASIVVQNWDKKFSLLNIKKRGEKIDSKHNKQNG